MIEQKLRDSMVEGQMHECLRDVGRIAGGCLSSGRISASDVGALCDLAKSLAINPRQAEREWSKAVAFGAAQPLEKTEMPRAYGSDPVDFDAVISDSDYRIVDENWLDIKEVEQPKDESWDPCKELADYISLLFQPDDYVGYCVDPFERDGKWLPSKGTYTNKAGDILKALRKRSKNAFEMAVGTLNNEKSGAWIRFNPLDGKGVSDTNITEYRYALVESDALEIEKQIAIYKKLELPCACIVNSGGKSAHAIVKVLAESIEEYRKRVDFLYEVCKNNGLPVDRQNRNPSRYSRMPGVVRDGRKQYIVERNCGKTSWDEWETWIKDLNDNLPEFESLASLDINNPPPLKPVVIDGVLREGFKMRLQGPSKAGKSFALIELAIAMSEGVEWIGHKCRQGRVLYINLELDRNSAINRFADIYRAMKIEPAHRDMIDCWHLRGKTMALDKLTPKLIRRAKDRGYAMIILDPIYKVLTGDENSASEMAKFCNYFDTIATECGCCFVDCHHHSKGGQSGKKSADRSSGSGVFARDPDAIIDFLPLVTTNAESQLLMEYEAAAMAKAADDVFYDGDWRSEVGDDVKCVPDKLHAEFVKMFPADDVAKIDAAKKAVDDEFSATGWRVSYTVRDFRPIKDRNVWFVHPFHTTEYDHLLEDCVPEGEDAQRVSSPRGGKRTAKSVRVASTPKKRAQFDMMMDPEGFKAKHTTIKSMAEEYGADRSNVRKWGFDFGFRFDSKTNTITWES